MDKVKNCPFCGGKAVIFIPYADYESYRVYCSSCGIGTLPSHDKEKAIAAWNRRAGGEGEGCPITREEAEILMAALAEETGDA